MTRGLKNFACLCLAVSAVGCGKEDSKTSSTDTNSSLAELAGTWKTACVPENDEYSAQELTIAGSAATLTDTNYSDANCTTATIVTKITFSISGGGSRATPAGTKDINLVMGTASMTPTSAELATGLNAQQFCGVTWEVSKAIDITDKKCGDEVLFPGGKKDYEIYKIDGSKLYLGADDEADHATPETRNVVLDSAPFVKS